MGRYAKGEDRRTAILDAALELIGQNGFRRATLADIADAVGLTKAGVLHHFGSKDELRILSEEELVAVGFDNPLRLIGVDPSAVRANTQVAGLVHLFTAVAAAAVEPEHGAHEFFVERYDRVRGQLEAAARREVEAGRLPPDVDVAQLARVLVALADGLQVQWLLDPSIDMAADIEAVLALARRASPAEQAFLALLAVGR